MWWGERSLSMNFGNPPNKKMSVSFFLLVRSNQIRSILRDLWMFLPPVTGDVRGNRVKFTPQNPDRVFLSSACQPSLKANLTDLRFTSLLLTGGKNTQAV